MSASSVFVTSVLAPRWGYADDSWKEGPAVLGDSSVPTVLVEVYQSYAGTSIYVKRCRTFSGFVTPDNLPVGLDLIPRWARGAVLEFDGANELERWINARGWPFVASYAVVGNSRGETFGIEVHGGLILKDSTDPLSTPSFVPTYPIPFGLALNTLFYIVLCISMYICVLYGTQFFRLLKGRCPKCKYALRAGGSIGCPECGWRRQQSE